MAWRVARSLLTLRDQINAAFPNRSKLSDGTIGDAAHATTNSDHNPWVKDGDMGVVTALDITHDPDDGCDCNKIVNALVASRDKRIKYVIWNGRIISSTISPWVWRTYTGSNQHNKHFHLSVNSTKSLYDSTAAWSIAPPQPKARFILMDGDGGVMTRSTWFVPGPTEQQILVNWFTRRAPGALKELRADGDIGIRREKS